MLTKDSSGFEKPFYCNFSMCNCNDTLLLSQNLSVQSTHTCMNMTRRPDFVGKCVTWFSAEDQRYFNGIVTRIHQGEEADYGKDLYNVAFEDGDEVDLELHKVIACIGPVGTEIDVSSTEHHNNLEDSAMLKLRQFGYIENHTGSTGAVNGGSSSVGNCDSAHNKRASPDDQAPAPKKE